MALLGLPAPAAAQTVLPLIRNGDTVLGMGGVQSLSSIAINDGKMWTTLVDTTFPENTRDGAILRSGFLTLRENVALLAPPSSILDEWNSSIQLNNNGDLGMIVNVRPEGAQVIQGAYFNLRLVALEDQPVNSPVVPAGTLWDSITVIKLNENNLMMLMGKVDGAPPNPTAKKDILARFQLDDDGNVLEETVLAYPGVVVEALETTVNSLPSSFFPTGLAMNKHGDFITFIGGTGNVNAIMLNMEFVLALERSPSPVGAPWNALFQTRAAINDRREYAFSGSLSGPNPYLVVKNGAKFVQAGDVLPSFSTNPIAVGGAAPIYIANTGDVFWRAETSSNESAFMRNHEAIIIQNRTIVEGRLVTKLEEDAQAFASSPNGRFLAGRVEFGANNDAILFADFGLVLDIPGCHGNLGVLTHESGKPLVGDHLEFAMDNGQGAGALAKIVFSLRQRIPGSDCGVNFPFGEVLTSAAHRVGIAYLPPWNGTQPTTVDIAIPNSLSLVDGVFFAQGYFRMPGTRNLRLTNGMRIELGAP
jgi:hypothetical protein